MGNNYEQFGPFLIFRAIGRGGMGEVFVARTPWDEYPLAAVKRLRPDVARVPNFAERFRREAELAVRLYHENVVATLDVGSVNEQLYVASELIPGKDTGYIGDRLRERGQGAPLAVVVRVLLDTLEGLSYVHSAKERNGDWMRLVHRDITPGNVLVGYDGVSRLADFGLAKSEVSTKSALTQHGEILGTPHYLAPEVIRGEPASPSSDIYGLGAVMYRVLTGVAPFQGTAAEVLVKALKSKPKPLADLRPDLPPWFVSVIHSMLDGDRIERPGDAGLLMRRIEHAAGRFKLLLPHDSVGRWLSALFEEEKNSEVSEFEAIASMSLEEKPPKVEGTMVLAKARSETRLEGGDPFGDENLDEATLMAKPLERDESAIGDETIQGAQLVGDSSHVAELIGLGDVAQIQKETMRTEMIPEEPEDYFPDSEDETGNFGDQVVLASESAELPGFIDDSGEKSLEARLITSPHRTVNPKSKVEPSAYPSRGPRVESNTASDEQDEIVQSSDAQLRHRSSKPEVKVSLSSPSARRVSSRPERKSTNRIEGERKDSRPARVQWTSSYWISLAIGLVAASVVGASIALWSTRSVSIEPKEITPTLGNDDLVALQKRYRDLRVRMNSLSEKGVGITPEVNRGAARAADLMLLGRVEEARQELDKLETFLNSAVE